MRHRKLELLVKNTKSHHDKAAGASVKKFLCDLIDHDGSQASSGNLQNSYVLLKVVATLSSRALALTCCGVDENFDCVAVSVFNVDEVKGVAVGDTITIARPVLRSHSVTLRDGTQVAFRMLRVTDLRTLTVNGRPVPSSWLAPVVLKSELYNS